MNGSKTIGSALALLALLAGCATTPPATGEAGTGDELYSGEPAVLHGTEMPVASAEEARERAAAAIAEGDEDLALYMYVQAVKLDDTDENSLLAIATIHARRGNLELAGRAFAGVIALNPGQALAHQGLGLVYFEARQLEPAESSLLEAVALDPLLWQAHSTLGIIADLNERYTDAISHYTAAIDLQPGQASMRNNRGYSRYLAGELAPAKEDFLAALRIDPAYERAWRNLGLVLAREQDYANAVSAMTRALPRHVALNDIGYIAMLDGNYAVAQSLLQDAIMASPRHYELANQNLAELNRRRGSALLATE